METRTEALLTELPNALQQPDGALQDLLEEYAPQDLAEAITLMDSPAEQAHALMQMDETVASEILEYWSRRWSTRFSSISRWRKPRACCN